MSANLDLVRSIYADWERGDLSKADWADPQIEYTSMGLMTPEEGATWKGLAGMARGTREAIEVFEDLRIEAEEYRELDGARVLVLDRRTARGKGSGITLGPESVASLGAHVFHIRNGKVAKLVVYLDRDRALAEVGLEE
jgi:ketosteroid isomerase-like protein